MLSALLPGVREFRTPLVIGLLWAASFWVLCGPEIAASNATTDFADELGLAKLPPTVWLGASALLAYLVGSLLVVRKSPFGQPGVRLREWLARKVERLDQDHPPARWRYRLGYRVWKRAGLSRPTWKFREWVGAPTMGPPETPALDEWLHNEFQAHVDDGLVPVMKSFPPGCDAPHGFAGYCSPTSVTGDPLVGLYESTWGSELVQFFVSAVKREQPAVEVRVQMKYPDVYAEIDRLRVEGELRLSVFWPLALLVLALSWAWSPFAVVLLVIPPLLVRDGFRRVAEADRKLWETVMSGEVTSPVLDAMKQVRDSGETFDFGKRFPDFHGVLGSGEQ